MHELHAFFIQRVDLPHPSPVLFDVVGLDHLDYCFFESGGLDNGSIWPYYFVQVMTHDVFVVAGCFCEIVGAELAISGPLAEIVWVVRGSSDYDCFGGPCAAEFVLLLFDLSACLQVIFLPVNITLKEMTDLQLSLLVFQNVERLALGPPLLEDVEDAFALLGVDVGELLVFSVAFFLHLLSYETDVAFECFLFQHLLYNVFWRNIFSVGHADAWNLALVVFVGLLVEDLPVAD